VSFLTPLQAPFPWFGGKSRAGAEIWQALGEPKNYVEPFCGSLAALLTAPRIHGVETVNDADGFVANFWRAVQAAPDGVARFADWPVNEADLEARHAWLLARTERLRWCLQDPDFFDAKIAGWWVWGQCAWIGTGWCSGEGPHRHDGAHFVNRQLPHLGNAGMGINRKLPHLGNAGRGINRQLPHLGNAGRGINRQLPHLGNAGRGINRKLPHLGDAGRGINRKLPHLGDAGRGIRDTMTALAERLRRVRVACGDWARVVTPAVTWRHGLTGVFLDPPYGEGAMEYSAGGNASSIASDVWKWAVENGAHKKLRIVVAAYEDGRAVPDGWTVRRWKARKGYSADGGENSRREVLYCSPRCEAPCGAP